MLNFILFFDYLHVGGDVCLLLILFANTLDPYQARQNVRPDLDPDCLFMKHSILQFCFLKIKSAVVNTKCR